MYRILVIYDGFVPILFFPGRGKGLLRPVFSACSTYKYLVDQFQGWVIIKLVLMVPSRACYPYENAVGWVGMGT